MSHSCQILSNLFQYWKRLANLWQFFLWIIVLKTIFEGVQGALASVADLVPAFVALSRSFLGFCLWIADPKVTHHQSFLSLCETICIIRKHIFCSRLPSRTHAPAFLRCNIPKFVAELDFVYTFLHCAMTLPPTLTTFNWPHSVYTAGHIVSMLCVDSPQVSEEPCACAHTCAKLPFWYRHYSPNFLDTNCMFKPFLEFLFVKLMAMCVKIRVLTWRGELQKSYLIG